MGIYTFMTIRSIANHVAVVECDFAEAKVYIDYTRFISYEDSEKRMMITMSSEDNVNKQLRNCKS